MAPLANSVLLIVMVISASAAIYQDEAADEGASFGIVFDTTGSMLSELRQLRSHALSLLNSALNKTGHPIKDFVWAPFNDPDVPEAIVTESPSNFREYLQRVTVDGGDDGPEMAFSGLLNALRLVRPRTNNSEVNETKTNYRASQKRRRSRSTIFVFTDNEPKDKHLLPDVKNLILQKKAVVIFILTQVTKYDEVYSELAALSSGQMVRLEASQVSDMMRFIDSSLGADRVNLMTVEKKNGSVDEYPVTIDKAIDEFTVSTTGTAASIEVKNPKGMIVTEEEELETLVKLQNIHVVRVNKPEPGIWNVTSSSTSDHSFRLTGVSKLDFVYGFSKQRAVSLNNTFTYPLKGVGNYMTITTNEINAIQRISHAEVKSSNGSLLAKLDVKPIGKNRRFYRSSLFTPTDDVIFVTFYALGRDGEVISRTSQTGVAAVIPEKASLLMEDEKDGGSHLRLPLYGLVMHVVFLTSCTMFITKCFIR